MDTTLPYPQAEEAVADQRLVERQNQIRSDEEAFRGLLTRLATSAIFATSSILVLLLLPFYPAPMAAFLAIVVGVLAFRWPALALTIMLLFAAPAYSYQLGVTIWALGIMAVIAIALPFGLAGLPGAALGSAVGAAAAALMLTPYFILAFPLLAGIPLLRLKGSTAAGGWGLFTFLAFYLPFLFIASPPASGSALPLFATVDYAQQPVLGNLDLASLKNAFQGQINNNLSAFPGSSAYFVQGFSGVALLLAMFVALLITPVALNPYKRIRENRILLRSIAPLVLLLLMELTFLLPIQLLQEPLGYHTGFEGWRDLTILTAIIAAAGITVFIAESWLTKRSFKVKLRSDLALMSLEMYDLLDNARRRLQQLASVCRNRDLGDERATITHCEEKVALTLESVSALGLTRLEVTHNEFCTMRSELTNLQTHLEQKLFTSLRESTRNYKTTVDEALALGIPTLREIIRTPPSPSEVQDYDSALAVQDTLNAAFQDLAQSLVSAGDMLASTIKEEIDPDFSLTTIDIAHGFLDQGRYEEAARTISEDLQIIDGRIEHSIVELAGRITRMAGDFKSTITSRLIPVFESIGDTDAAARSAATIEELDSIINSVQGSRTLADMISIVEQSRRLAALATEMVTQLSRKTERIEAENDKRCPPKYNWGRNNYASSEAQQLLQSIETVLPEATIGSRFSVIEKAVQAMEHQGRAIRQYSQASEFLINYPNIEYILQEKLSNNTGVAAPDLPVKPKYALEYLRMYAAKNGDEVTFDLKSASLKHNRAKETRQQESSK